MKRLELISIICIVLMLISLSFPFKGLDFEEILKQFGTNDFKDDNILGYKFIWSFIPIGLAIGATFVINYRSSLITAALGVFIGFLQLFSIVFLKFKISPILTLDWGLPKELKFGFYLLVLISILYFLFTVSNLITNVKKAKQSQEKKVDDQLLDSFNI